jgi:riboflavin kinase / FMN adenylyltransferase
LKIITGDPFAFESPGSKGCIMLGYMDGVHLGHQKLASTVTRKAKQLGSYPAVFTFNGLLYTKSIPSFHGLLTPHAEKAQLLEELGIDALMLVDFTPQLRDMPASDFVNLILKDKLDASFVACGPGFSFGKGGLGKSEDLVKFCNQVGIEAEVIGSVHYEGKPVSSTRIRNLLLEGNVEDASKMLGRNYKISGQVVHGHGIGKVLGFPTANITVPDKMKLVPGDGVYACIARFDGKRVVSAVSIGNRPTFDDTQRSIEAHLLDFDGVLYNHDVEIEFVSYLRGQRTFENQEALIAEVMRNIEQTRKLLEDYHE